MSIKPAAAQYRDGAFNLVRGESSLRPAHRHRIIHNLPLDQLRFHIAIAIAKVSANTAASIQPGGRVADRERNRRPTQRMWLDLIERAAAFCN
ncbi:hypothetical protein [Bradyrhizobium sp. WSM1253]|uniref:hypothetical protein n=1 Tax=Bradyrhizobium sp. WSM1253 TaxID=319003 RepID=UPI0012F4B9D2|nr:hypothetical protein [Bradyrhizobium sp. WSM1253]